MTERSKTTNGSDFKEDFTRWQHRYDAEIGTDRDVINRSGIPIKPLYTPLDWSPDKHDGSLGVPGEAPFTRGIYSTMHRGRTWTQRQLIGLGTPGDYNSRVRTMLDNGASAISLLPCNSGFRGIDCDESPLALLGTDRKSVV